MFQQQQEDERHVDSDYSCQIGGVWVNLCVFVDALWSLSSRENGAAPRRWPGSSRAWLFLSSVFTSLSSSSSSPHRGYHLADGSILTFRLLENLSHRSQRVCESAFLAYLYSRRLDNDAEARHLWHTVFCQVPQLSNRKPMLPAKAALSALIMTSMSSKSLETRLIPWGWLTPHNFWHQQESSLSSEPTPPD